MKKITKIAVTLIILSFALSQCEQVKSKIDLVEFGLVKPVTVNTIIKSAIKFEASFFMIFWLDG